MNAYAKSINKDPKELLKEGRCPECGYTLIHQGGCVYCPICGWSACSGS